MEFLVTTSNPPKKILVVDDSETSIAATRIVLENAGYAVVTTDNPMLTSMLALTEAPNLILLDVLMKTLDGDEIVRAMRKRRTLATIPIILYSKKDPVELGLLAAECGATGYIHKQSSGQQLVQRIEHYLSIWYLQQKGRAV